MTTQRKPISSVPIIEKDESEYDFVSITQKLHTLLPEIQINEVFSQYGASADISFDFLGFVDIYFHLSKIIPKHFKVIDFGCAYNAQSFFFTKHREYIGVEPNIEKVFLPENGKFFKLTTKQYIEKYVDLCDIDKTFAICSYVPPWHEEDSIKLVKETFKNIFTFYPSR